MSYIGLVDKTYEKIFNGYDPGDIFSNTLSVTNNSILIIHKSSEKIVIIKQGKLLRLTSNFFNKYLSDKLNTLEPIYYIGNNKHDQERIVSFLIDEKYGNKFFRSDEMEREFKLDVITTYKSMPVLKDLDLSDM